MLSQFAPVGSFLASIPEALLFSRLLQPQHTDNKMKDTDNITVDLSAIENRQIPFAQMHNLIVRMRDMAPGERVGYGDLDAERIGDKITVTLHVERTSTSTNPEDLA